MRTKMIASDFIEKFAAGLDEGLSAATKLPFMLTVLRNGGAESVLRGVVLGELERATRCLAFSVAENMRVDAVLREVPDGRPAAFIEFKHNFIGQRSSEIQSSTAKAKTQLDGSVASFMKAGSPVGENPPLAIYIHFFVSLGVADEDVVLSKLHNAHVRTSYKKFTRMTKLEQCYEETERAFGIAKAFRNYPVDAPEGLVCSLDCWAFTVEQGSLQPISLNREWPVHSQGLCVASI